jgi:hypothetical protein
VIVGAAAPKLHAQLIDPPADQLRFQLVRHEPLAAPDSRSVAAGWFATVIKDRRTGNCFLSVTEGTSMSTTPIACQ